MVEEKEHKKQIFVGVKFWKRGYGGAEPDLNVVWFYTVTISAGIAIIVVVLHFLLYLRISSNEIFNVEQREQPPIETINREKLQEILEFFSARESTLRKVRGE